MIAKRGHRGQQQSIRQLRYIVLADAATSGWLKVAARSSAADDDKLPGDTVDIGRAPLLVGG